MEVGQTKKNGMRSIKTKLLTLVFGMLLVVVIILTINELYGINSMIHKIDGNKINVIQSTIEKEMNDQIRQAKIAVHAVADNPEIIKAFANNDRKHLAQLVDPVFEELLVCGIQQLQFHTPKSISFYRAHKPEKFDDDLSELRPTVVYVNDKHKEIGGVESGVAGFGFRYVMPVEYKGEHIGSAEIGMAFGTNYLKVLQETVNGKYYIYLFDSEPNEETGQAFLAATEEKDNYVNEEKDISILKEGQTVSYLSDNEKELILLVPFKDYAGEYKGFIKSVVSRNDEINYKNTMVLKTGLVSSICLIISLFIAYQVSKSIAVPILKINKKAGIVANGDLTVDIEETYSGEAGMLAHGFNILISNIKEMIKSMGKVTNRLEDTVNSTIKVIDNTNRNAVSISESTKQVAEANNDLAENITNIASATEEVNSCMGKLTNTIEQVNSTINDSIEKTMGGHTSMLELNENIKSVHTESEHMSGLIIQLKDDAKKIEGITEIIAGIAKQTNLLSLNASIEAARSGEAGKGFAVVAEQIGLLAKASNLQVSEINKLVTIITNNIADISNSSNATVGLIQEQQKIGNDTTNRLNEIIVISENIVGLLKEMNQDSSNAVSQTKRVSTEVSQVAALSQENAAITEEIASATECLRETIHEVEQSADGLTELINLLTNEQQRFKTE